MPEIYKKDGADANPVEVRPWTLLEALAGLSFIAFAMFALNDFTDSPEMFFFTHIQISIASLILSAGLFFCSLKRDR